MKRKYLDARIIDNYIIVYYKNKELFKASNNVNNATTILRMIQEG